MPPSDETKAKIRRDVAGLVAYFADRPADTLQDGDFLDDRGYGLSKYHMEAMAKPLTHISKHYGGGTISVSAAAKAQQFGDLVKLVVNAIP